MQGANRTEIVVTRRASLSHMSAPDLRAVVLLALLLLAAGRARAQSPSREPAQPPTPDRCFRARPALTYSATGIPEQGNTDPWSLVEFRADGRVGRPLLPLRHSERSRWRVLGDTLRLRLSDGLVGWDVVATPDSLAYVGIATYLTDVVVKGAEPLRVRVRLEPTVCISAPPA